MSRSALARLLRHLFGPTVLGLALAGCGTQITTPPGERDGPGEHRDVSHVPDAVPRVEPRSRGGNPSTYVVLGKRYYTLQDNEGFVQRGIASWYGRKFHGRTTSNGEIYDMYRMSAAHKRLPIPTYLEVTNLENGRRVVVRVNDRGPFHENRIIDLSYAAASRIGMLDKGTALVEIRAIDPRAPQPVKKTRVAKAPDQGQEAGPQTVVPRIFLQAGAFSDTGNAERLRRRLEGGLSRRVRVTPAASAKGPVHRVQVGPFASVEMADRVTAQMHQLGVSEPLVVID
ncbi:MAG: septal ring lytic transglycosylase RlpA family protein [Chromatiaceae bacterium]